MRTEIVRYVRVQISFYAKEGPGVQAGASMEDHVPRRKSHITANKSTTKVN